MTGQVILCDVMGTLTLEPFGHAIPAFFNLSPGELTEALDHESWVAFEKGEIGHDEFMKRMFKDRRAVDGGALCELVQRSYQWFDGMEDLLSELAEAGHSIHALSNYPVWYNWVETSLNLSRYLDWTFVSCLTGRRKPAAEAFLLAARSLGVACRDCLVIDDRADNVESARGVGMQVILFEGGWQLRAELRRRGVC